MEGAASQGEQKRPNLLHYASGYSTADVCVFLQRPEAVLRHVQEVHGKAVEKKYWIRRDAYSLVVAREEQRRRSHQREKQHREGALKSPS